MYRNSSSESRLSWRKGSCNGDLQLNSVGAESGSLSHGQWASSVSFGAVASSSWWAATDLSLEVGINARYHIAIMIMRQAQRDKGGGHCRGTPICHAKLAPDPDGRKRRRDDMRRSRRRAGSRCGLPVAGGAASVQEKTGREAGEAGELRHQTNSKTINTMEPPTIVGGLHTNM